MAKPKVVFISLNDKDRAIEGDLASEFEVVSFRSPHDVFLSFEESKKNIPAGVIFDQSIHPLELIRFLSRVRSDAVLKKLPVILVTREVEPKYLEMACRWELSHCIGIPCEPKVFLQKIKTALSPMEGVKKNPYFRLKTEIPVKALLSGQLHSIGIKGLHFSSHMKPKIGSVLHIESQMTQDQRLPPVAVKVTSCRSNTSTFHPFSIECEWDSQMMKVPVREWINKNRHLHFAKKSKVAVVASSSRRRQEFTEAINLSYYTPLYFTHLWQVVDDLWQIKPDCIAISELDWELTQAELRSDFFVQIQRLHIPWILSVASVKLKENWFLKPFLAPVDCDGLRLAIEKVIPPKPFESDRMYFSDEAQNPWITIHLDALALQVGELGLEFAVEQLLIPPCNLQIRCDFFHEPATSKPFVRIWPPLKRMPFRQSAGKMRAVFGSHFLGIHDQTAQPIRLWVRDGELKDRKRELAPIPPKRK